MLLKDRNVDKKMIESTFFHLGAKLITNHYGLMQEFSLQSTQLNIHD